MKVLNESCTKGIIPDNLSGLRKEERDNGQYISAELYVREGNS